MTKIAIYCRVSTSMQADDEVPIASQLLECQKFASARGWEIAKVYKDEGFTGRNTARVSGNAN